jgi:hypothetical protein
MASNPVIYPPTIWANQDIVLYHGTLDSFVSSIVNGPIRTSFGRTYTDFGPGFYTTTLFRQAHTWGAQIAASRPGSSPAVVELQISRSDLATLQTLAFIRGDFHADGATDHGRTAPLAPYYDVVYGPVAAFWNQRMSIADADQISFHTAAAEAVLNNSARRRII